MGRAMIKQCRAGAKIPSYLHRLCALSAHIAQCSTKMMAVITSILPLRKVKCREMTWQQLHTRLVASTEKSMSLGFVLPSPGFIDF